MQPLVPLRFPFFAQCHYGYGAPIIVYYLGHLFSNYNVLMSNFDNYSSNSIVSDDQDQNILHNLGINGHPNKQFTFGPESKSNIIYTSYVDYLHILKLKLHFILTHTAKCNCA